MALPKGQWIVIISQMQTRLIWFLTALLHFVEANQASAQGYFVPNGIWVNSGNSQLPSQIYLLHNPVNPKNSGYTGFDLVPDGKRPSIHFGFNPLVDLGVRVFLVQSGDSISLSPIIAGTYPEFESQASYVFENRSVFLLGLYTGNTGSQSADGTYANPLFGWIKLRNSNGSIQLLDSALVYQADGIYAGTRNMIQSVPEPATVSLGTLGMLLLWRCRKGSAHW